MKKSLCVFLAYVTALPLFFVPATTEASAATAANAVIVNLSEEKQVIRGFGGMNHSVWIGDLTPAQRETAFGNGENQLGFSVLRIPIHENMNNWQREVETAKKAIEHGAIVFASPWNPPSEMVETFTLGISSGSGTIYEAETGTQLTNSVVQSTYSGYTGTGYVDFQAASDAAIQWNNIIIGITGTKNVKIRYAQQTAATSLDVYVNGTKVMSNVAFEATGNWNTWAEKSIQIPMVSGTSTLKLVNTGTEGPNIDQINLAAYTEDPKAKRLKHDMYDDYAQYLNEFDSFMKSNGVNLYAISIQNEPDYAHDWTWWSPEEMLRFMKENAGTIHNRVIAPESFSFVKRMSDPILNDPEALSNMDILGAHTYGTNYKDFPYPSFKQKGAGKELWMTEVYYPNSDTNSADRWPEALGVAEHMYNAMVEGNFQTYVWWYIRRHYGPMKDDGTISKRGYSMAHYSKFIRPGYVRVEATKNPDPLVYTSAYKGDNKVVIVAVNKGTSAARDNFVLQNGSASTVSSWVTDSSRNLAAGAPIHVSNSSFTADLPPQSVTTFVAEIAPEKIAPVTTHSIAGDVKNGWYRTPVNVTLTAENEGTGVAHTYFKLNRGAVSEGTTAQIVDEGKNRLNYWSVDKAGNVEVERSVEVNIDLAAPTVTFSVYDTEYGVDQNVVMGCLAKDALSGIASSDCKEISVKAYELGVGDHTFTATAEDTAGNGVSQSITITVTVDFDSLRALVADFVKTDNGIRQALVEKLNQTKASASKGNTNVVQAQLKAFMNQVNAQSGKALTEHQAQVLTDLAQLLK